MVGSWPKKQLAMEWEQSTCQRRQAGRSTNQSIRQSTLVILRIPRQPISQSPNPPNIKHI
jgi:hypothetical protein